MKRFFAALLALMLGVCPAAYAQEEALWYEDQARALVRQMDALMRDGDYLELMTGSEEVLSALEPLKQTDFTACPQSAQRLEMGDEKAVQAVMRAMDSQVKADPLSDVCQTALAQRLPAALITHLNAGDGAAWMAAATVCTASATFVLPENFENAVVVLRFEGDYWAAVGFAQTGEETGTAAASFIRADSQQKLDTIAETVKAAGMDVRETVYD